MPASFAMTTLPVTAFRTMSSFARLNSGTACERAKTSRMTSVGTR